MCIIDLSLSFQVSPKQQNCSTYMCLTDYIIPSSIYMDSNDNDKTVVRNKHQMLCQEMLCLDNLYGVIIYMLKAERKSFRILALSSHSVICCHKHDILPFLYNVMF